MALCPGCLPLKDWVSAVRGRFFLDAEDGILQYDLGFELREGVSGVFSGSYGYVGKASLLPAAGVFSREVRYSQLAMDRALCVGGVRGGPRKFLEQAMEMQS